LCTKIRPLAAVEQVVAETAPAGRAVAALAEPVVVVLVVEIHRKHSLRIKSTR
jgi:hypothetical protein